MKSQVKRYLGKRGYILRKDDLTKAKQEEIRKSFTAKPFVPRGVPVSSANEPFPVFLENKNKFYLPKAKATEMFGKPEVNKMPKGQDRPGLKFAGTLRNYQQEPVATLLEACKERGGGILSVPGGRGKCMAIGTPLLMANGTVKPIEQIETGDLLMGDGNEARKVLSICVGTDLMYRVEMPAHQVSYVVNGAHILCLRREGNENDILEISVEDLLGDQVSEQRYSAYGGYSAPLVRFQRQKHIYRTDPYIIGMWLARGEIGTVNVQYKRNLLNYYGIMDRSNIPIPFKCGSPVVRWRLLGGFVDGLGSYNSKMNRFEIKVLKTLERDVLFVARSLGYRATVHGLSGKNHVLIHVEGNDLHRVHILIKKNRPVTYAPRKDYRFSPIKITLIGVDNYCGFMLDGNGRYLLESCTVTHNTVMAIKMMAELKKKVLVIVHKNFLADQWYRRIKGGVNPDTEKFEEGFMPEAKVGRIQAQIFDIEDKDIVIAMLQSVSMKEYEMTAFDSFGFVVIDECHCIPCKVFSRALRKVNAPYMVGLTATPSRTDGLFKVLQWYLGKIEYIMKEDTKENKRNVAAHRYIYESDDTDYSKLIYNRLGGLDNVKMLGNLCGYKPRTAVICSKTFELALAGRNILTLSERRDHLAEMESAYNERTLHELMPLIETEITETIQDAPLDDEKTKTHLTKKVVSKIPNNEHRKSFEEAIEEYEADREDLLNTVFAILKDGTVREGQDLAHKLNMQLDDGDEITFEQADLDVKYGQLSEELNDFQKIKSENELVDFLESLYEPEREEEADIIKRRKDVLYQLGAQKKITKNDYSLLVIKNKSKKLDKIAKVMAKLSQARQDQLNGFEAELTAVRNKLKPINKIISATRRRYNAAVRDLRDILAPIVKIHVYRAILTTKGQLTRDPLTIRVGYYIGGMKESELQSSENCEIILGTYQMASEGLDIPALNTLVMATPKGANSNVFKQATWRIMRKANENFNPLIVDFCDLYGSYRDKAVGRMRYFRRLKYPITTQVLDQNGNIKETFAEMTDKKGKKLKGAKQKTGKKRKKDTRPRNLNLIKGKNIFGKKKKA